MSNAKISFFRVSNRKITRLDDVNYTGVQDADRFHFIFDEEWDGLDKVIKIYVKDKMYEYPLLHDDVIVDRRIYLPGFISIGVYGIKDGKILATGLISIPIDECAYSSDEPDNLPTKTQWDLYVEEINDLLTQANTTKEMCEEILRQLVEAQEECITELESIKDDTLSIKHEVEVLKDETSTIFNFAEQTKEDIATMKTQIETDITEAEGVLATYNANYEQKLTDFNSNFTAKKKIIDDDVSDFESDYTQKMNDLNTAGSTQVGNVNAAGNTQVGNVNSAGATQKAAVESAGATQVGNVNTAGSTKVSEINSAGSTQVNAVNSAGSTQVAAVESAGTQQTSAVNTAGETQVGNVNSAGTDQTNAVNQAGQQKLEEINSNQTVQQVSDHEIRITRLEKASHIYGVKRARNNNSSTAWERTDDAIGLVANAQIGTTPVENKFDGIKPWSNIIRKNIDLITGLTTAYYGEAEFKLDGSNGDVYNEYPDIYWKVWQDENYDYVQIADGPMEGFTKTKSFDLAVYLNGYVDGKLRSYSGLAPARNASIGTYRTRAGALGNNFCLLDWRYFVIQLLYLVEYADRNSQAKLGQGFTALRNNKNDKALVAETSTNRIIINSSAGAQFIVGQTIAIGATSNEKFEVAADRIITQIDDYDEDGVTGKAISFDGEAVDIAVGNVIWSCGQHSGSGDFLGMKSGCYADDGKHAVNYRGIENIFGNIFQFVDGLNFKDGQAYVCYDPSEYRSDKFTEPYEAIGYINAYSGSDNYNGYVKTLGFDSNHPLVRFPIELGGSNATYVGDNYYISTGNRVARVGGPLDSGVDAGLWFCRLTLTSSSSSWGCGARVLKYQT